LAYVFGRRKDDVFLQLKALLEPFGLTRFYTDYWGAYTRHLEPDVHSPGKRKHAENRAQASDLTDADQTLGPQDDLLLEIDTDARHCHWLVCEPICLWTGGVNMAISTFRTLPSSPYLYHLCHDVLHG
jgi:hypothetical protein